MVRRKKNGFSLLELVTVATLLGIVAVVVIYRLNSLDQHHAKSQVNRQNVTIIQSAVERYRFDHGGLPKTLSALVADGYLPTTPTPPGGIGTYVIDGETGIVSYAASNDSL